MYPLIYALHGINIKLNFIKEYAKVGIKTFFLKNMLFFSINEIINKIIKCIQNINKSRNKSNLD